MYYILRSGWRQLKCLGTFKIKLTSLFFNKVLTKNSHYSMFRITVSCCVLHNLALNWKMPLLDEWDIEDLDIEDDEELADLEVRPTGGTAIQRETILRRKGNEKRQKVAFNTFQCWVKRVLLENSNTHRLDLISKLIYTNNLDIPLDVEK